MSEQSPTPGPGVGSTRERERDLDRFLTFVDAVVAISITLLVLPLVDIVQDLGDRSVGHLLLDHAAELYAFTLSFFVVARLWFVQHRLLHFVVSEVRAASVLLVLWLFLIVLLPFTTALVAETYRESGVVPGQGQTAASTLYLVLIALSSFCLAGVGLVVARHPECREPGRLPDTAGSVVTGLVFLLGVVVSLVRPGLSYVPLLLLVVSDRASDAWNRRRDARLQAAEASGD